MQGEGGLRGKLRMRTREILKGRLAAREWSGWTAREKLAEAPDITDNWRVQVDDRTLVARRPGRAVAVRWPCVGRAVAVRWPCWPCVGRALAVLLAVRWPCVGRAVGRALRPLHHSINRVFRSTRPVFLHLEKRRSRTFAMIQHVRPISGQICMCRQICMRRQCMCRRICMRGQICMYGRICAQRQIYMCR